MFQPLFYFALILGIFPILILKLKRNSVREDIICIEPFLWLIIISSFYEFFGTSIMKVSTEVWFRLYLLLEFSALFYFFWKLHKGKFKAFFIGFGTLFLLSFVASLFFWNDWSKLKTDSFLSVLEIIFVYFSSIAWFKDIFTGLQEKSLLALPAFYFISGFILYFSGTLFLFLIADQLSKSGVSFNEYWIYNVVFNIILRFFLIIGILKACKK